MPKTKDPHKAEYLSHKGNLYKKTTREALEAVVKIMGNNCAAKEALDDASKHVGDCIFWEGHGTLIVQKL